MKREIKFRAKTRRSPLIGKRGYSEPKEVYGMPYNLELNKLRDAEGYQHDIVKDTLCQFTGLKDKNGKEIYEGDIMKSLGSDICVVVFVEKLACFMLENTNPTKETDLILFELNIGYKHREVIGNIYEKNTQNKTN